MGLPPAALCPDCCECPQPIIEWDSIPASKTKCGNAEWSGFESTPPKIYSILETTGYRELTATTGTYWIVSGAGTVSERIYSGATVSFYKKTTLTTDKESCEESEEIINTRASDSFEYGTTTLYLCPVETPILGPTPLYLSLTDNDVPCDTTISSTEREFYIDDNTPGGGWPSLEDACNQTGDATDLNVVVGYYLTTCILSDEYTTAQLLANTLAALPAYDDDWNDTAGSYFDLTSDELTNSIRESRYRFKFKIPKVGRGTCYKITWNEVFTPEVGDPVETPKCSIWDGVIPDGYDPNDSATWPIIGDGTNPYFELAIPEENGTITVDPASVVAVCRGCGVGCPE